MTFANLESAKRKLDIPSGDTSKDVAISEVVGAVNNWITQQTGLTDIETEQTEYFQSVQMNVPLHLNRRPIKEIVSAEGRQFGGSYGEIPCEVVDPISGIVAIHSYSGHGSQILMGYSHNAWSSWRMGRWPMVRITYTAEPTNPIPDDLADAASALSAYWYSRHMQNNLVMVGLGSLIERYSIDSVPVHISSVLVHYVIEEPVWA